MLRIIFRNMRPSELIRAIIKIRFEPILKKFPEIRRHSVSFSVAMENSPFKTGPDLFSLKMRIHGKKYKDIFLNKSSPNFYMALAEVQDHLLERLNRYGDRSRVRHRHHARQFLQSLQPTFPQP